jgi:hypothetical protein
MPQSQVQVRNTEQVRILTGDFLTNQRFFWDGARLLSAVFATHAAGGGNLIYGWMADSLQNHGDGYLTAWTGTNIASGDYAATDYGGPYVNLNGTTEYLSIADAAWQETTIWGFLVWHWVYANTLIGSDRVIAAKYNTAANQSWRLYWNNAAGAFRLSTSAGGAADTEVTSTYAESTGEWYFVAGYFEPNTLMRVYVGTPDDPDLTIDSLAVGVPASVFDGNAALSIGCSYAAGVAGSFWDGYIGIGSQRANVPSASIDAYVRRLFGLTKEIYQ